MVSIGQTKTQYCSICGHETKWEYISIQMPERDCSSPNWIMQDAHQISLWHCCTHSKLKGLIKVEFNQATTLS